MNNDIPPHTLWHSLGLHLLPGALLTAFYYLSAPLLMRVGYPVWMSLLLAILVVLIPFELGYLLYQGHKESGRLSLKSVVLNSKPLPLWQYFVLVPLLLGWSAAVFTAFTPLDEFFLRTLFAWIPAWSIPSTFGNIAQYSRSVFLDTFVLGLALNGLAGPIVEELYFRGYLLPRLPASRAWAPLINVLLFSLYHFFSPWQNVTRIVAFSPLVYAVSWKRNIHLSIFTHCLLNTLGMLSSLALVAQ